MKMVLRLLWWLATTPNWATYLLMKFQILSLVAQRNWTTYYLRHNGHGSIADMPVGLRFQGLIVYGYSLNLKEF